MPDQKGFSAELKVSKQRHKLRSQESKSAYPVEALNILLRLKNGDPVSNSAFDTILPEPVRRFSRRHWTPVQVAVRAAQLLAPAPGTRVLDVGSGPGKFCMIGALTTEGNFVGIERRRSLVELARRTVKALSVPRVHFIHENMTDVDWNQYDSFYLYNPFYENIEPSAQIDHLVLMGEVCFAKFVKIVEEKLTLLKRGSRVVTYHGFGGCFPAEYRRLLNEPHGNDFLELWIKDPQGEYSA